MSVTFINIPMHVITGFWGFNNGVFKIIIQFFHRRFKNFIKFGLDNFTVTFKTENPFIWGCKTFTRHLIISVVTGICDRHMNQWITYQEAQDSV